MLSFQTETKPWQSGVGAYLLTFPLLLDIISMLPFHTQIKLKKSGVEASLLASLMFGCMPNFFVWLKTFLVLPGNFRSGGISASISLVWLYTQYLCLAKKLSLFYNETSEVEAYLLTSPLFDFIPDIFVWLKNFLVLPWNFRSRGISTNISLARLHTQILCLAKNLSCFTMKL